MSKTTPQQNKSTCLLLHKVRKISLTLTSISACVQFLFPKQNYLFGTELFLSLAER